MLLQALEHELSVLRSKLETDAKLHRQSLAGAKREQVRLTHTHTHTHPCTHTHTHCALCTHIVQPPLQSERLFKRNVQAKHMSSVVSPHCAGVT